MTLYSIRVIAGKWMMREDDMLLWHICGKVWRQVKLAELKGEVDPWTNGDVLFQVVANLNHP